MKYKIRVPELHIAEYEIEADTPQEALDKIPKGEFKLISCEYYRKIEQTELPGARWEIENI